MVKGCQKKVICIKDTGSDMFEEAFFIMKPSKDGVPKEGDMIREARRILENSRAQQGRTQCSERNNKSSKMMIFFSFRRSFCRGCMCSDYCFRKSYLSLYLYID